MPTDDGWLLKLSHSLYNLYENYLRREWSQIQHKSTSIGESHRESACWMEKIIRIFHCSLFIYIYMIDG